MCKIDEESVEHLFSYFPVARDIFAAVLLLFWVKWLTTNFCLDSLAALLWFNEFFGLGLYRERNRRVF